MIKCETLGMLDVAKVNPIIKSTSAVPNYSFVNYDGDLYLIANSISGDNAYKDDVTIPAGEYLNGFLVKAWEGQNLVVDERHIAYASQKDYSDLKVEDTANSVSATLLKVASSGGKLEVTAEAPTSGVYFKVVDKLTLTGKAIKVKVIVVDEKTVG